MELHRVNLGNFPNPFCTLALISTLELKHLSTSLPYHTSSLYISEMRNDCELQLCESYENSARTNWKNEVFLNKNKR